MSALAVAEEAATEGIRFRDYFPGKNRGHGYAIPNESVAVWRNLLKGKRFNRAGGICSAGEVGFFSLLPSVREELVLVDHCYASLQYAMVKYLMLKEYGFAGVFKLLAAQGREGLHEATKKAFANLPESVRNGNYYTGGDRLSISCAYTMWKDEVDKAAKSVAALDKVTFVHGDFVGIAELGPFECFYISNAHEVSNGNDDYKNLSDLNDALVDGAWILSARDLRHEISCYNDKTGRYEKKNCLPDNWEFFKQGEKPSRYMSWQYNVYRVHKK